VEPGRVDVLFVGHATVRLDLDGVRVVTDPLLRRTLGPLERHGLPPDPAALTATDLVLISHGHPDHFDRGSLRLVADAGVVVVPRGLGRVAQRHVHGTVVELAAGEHAQVGAVRVEAVPAHHWIVPGAPRAEPVGYLVEGSTSVYFAGDTGRHPGLARLAGRVDVALLPVWTWGPHLGPGHLGPRSAAELLADLGAQAAVPVHWGTLYPRRLHHVHRRPLDEPGDRFARHAAAVAPGADVQVLRPGEERSFRLRPRRVAPCSRG
jgi:L-ascorbate metabolism protein UlaG (beta-lactamase superfamily)